MRHPIRPLAAALCAVPLLAASAVGWAADKTPARKELSFGGSKGGPALTKEQLRKCLAQQDEVKTQDADLVREQAELNAQKAEIARVGDDLKSRLDTLDRSNAEAVNGYNESVKAREAQIDAYQARADKFNAGVDANQTAHQQFGDMCSNRRYLEDDETAIRKGK